MSQVEQERRAAVAIDAAIAKQAQQAARESQDLVVTAMTVHRQGVSEDLWPDDGTAFARIFDAISAMFAELSSAILRDAAEAKLGKSVKAMPQSLPPMPAGVRGKLLAKVSADILDYARDKRKADDEAARRKGFQSGPSAEALLDRRPSNQEARKAAARAAALAAQKPLP